MALSECNLVVNQNGDSKRESESFRRKKRGSEEFGRVALDYSQADFKRESFEIFSGSPQTLAPVADIRKALKKFSSGLPVNQPVAWFSI